MRQSAQSSPSPLTRAAGKDLLAAARSITESAPEVERWLAIISQEREQLVAELKRAGFWQPVS